MSENNNAPQIDEQALIEGLKTIVEAIQSQDNQAIGLSLAGFVRVGREQGLDAHQVLGLLEQNGIKGGEALHAFIHEQYTVLDETAAGN